jgi:RNA polymerase sigma-70 factor (ECF subfamily)
VNVLVASPGVPFRPVDAERSTAEAELVARLRDGEVAALGDAYELHHEHVRAFVRRFLGDDDAAEDLLQEAFLSLPRAIRGFREEASLRTFLLSLAVNHARHHVRAAVRRRAAMGRHASEPPASPAGPESDASRKQLATALVRGLDRLSLEHRAVVVLCDVEERTSAEAALVVGAPEATVRTRLFHARRNLREFLVAEGFR